MGNNIFMTDRLPIRFEEYLQYDENSRENLGQELPVLVYRMLEYSLKEELCRPFWKRNSGGSFPQRRPAWPVNILQNIC